MWKIVTSVLLLALTISGMARQSSLRFVERKQNLAIAKARQSVVHIKAYKSNHPGMENIGSGVVVSPRGHIVTNFHVVSGFDSFLVTVKQGRRRLELAASLVEKDPKMDLALLKINRSVRLMPIPIWNNKNRLQLGETIFVIGSPFALEQTVTRGIISKRQRSVAVDGVLYGDMIQTDANINRGNSGGAVINMSGEAVGLTSAIFSEGANSSGLGFAIPFYRVQQFYRTRVESDAMHFLKDFRAKTIHQGNDLKRAVRPIPGTVILRAPDRTTKQYKIEQQRITYHLPQGTLIYYTAILMIITIAIMMAIYLFLRRSGGDFLGITVGKGA
ncbi:MAG: trypsin-like serine protease [Bdellovibrionales bacterium]|jgi:S1-C subfamily serine protease|nr:trypsin-like serine protease [Bdellovibrionales bacterium]